VLETLRHAAPESLTYATSGVGGVLHLQSEMLAQLLGNRFVHVPYRSGALMLQAIHTGEAQFGIAALASAAAMLKDGMVRGVAMVGPTRFPVFPDIPTLGELGVAGFDSPAWFALVAPAGLPAEVAATLNRALNAALAEPALRERMLQAGHFAPSGDNGLAHANRFMAQEVQAQRDIVARTGVRLEP
jgi:tripartite-type tricarboxylate transporter receptor subunit TctC